MEHSSYRIIDANFNRAREAARVVEEFCRFGLNSSFLSGRAKQLRHELSGQIKQLDTRELICSRDTLCDVGVGKEVDNQLERSDLEDSFTAGCKRLSEALRVLSETIWPMDKSVANTIEQLRYRAYTLEKDIVIFSDTQKRFADVKLYVLISSDSEEEVLSLTDSCIKGGADCIQLRSKNLSDEELFAISGKFVKKCRASGVLSIINDRADIAIASGADGVHLGQDDLPIAAARKLQITPLIIGKSTHSVEQLRKACEDNPTYVALGPVYATSTKPQAGAVGLEYICQANEVLEGTGIASVAIGAITVENVGQVFKAGVQAVAICSAITSASDTAAACLAIKQEIKAVIG